MSIETEELNSCACVCLGAERTRLLPFFFPAARDNGECCGTAALDAIDCIGDNGVSVGPNDTVDGVRNIDGGSCCTLLELPAAGVNGNDVVCSPAYSKGVSGTGGKKSDPSSSISSAAAADAMSACCTGAGVDAGVAVEFDALLNRLLMVHE